MSRLQTIREKVDTLYHANNPNADVWADWAYDNHVLVVAATAEKLAKQHKANVEFAVAGALLHDIADVVMDRDTPGHETKSLDIAQKILSEADFSESEVDIITHQIIEPHGCNDVMPETIEGKIVATADGAAHFTTDFYAYFCWMHYGPDENYEHFKEWVLKKIEKDFTKKLFFDDVKNDIRPRYEAIKLVFS